MSNFIQFNQVSKWFESAAGRFDALKDINLTIGQGEYVAIVGKSGSGKSTLLNMLTGIDHPSRGKVTINASDIHTLNESRLAAWRGEKDVRRACACARVCVHRYRNIYVYINVCVCVCACVCV